MTSSMLAKLKWAFSRSGRTLLARGSFSFALRLKSLGLREIKEIFKPEHTAAKMTKKKTYSKVESIVIYVNFNPSLSTGEVLLPMC